VARFDVVHNREDVVADAARPDRAEVRIEGPPGFSTRCISRSAWSKSWMCSNAVIDRIADAELSAIGSLRTSPLMISYGRLTGAPRPACAAGLMSMLSPTSA
jgi:hypothetical protein